MNRTAVLIALCLFTSIEFVSSAAAKQMATDWVERRHLVLLAGVSESSQKPQVSVTDCDRLAASAHDPEAVAAAVEQNAIDAAKAIAACQEALKQNPGTARFEFQLGRALERSGDHAAAFRAFLGAAEMGHAAAMNNLAHMYADGAGVGENDAEALRWYRKAAELGLPLGMYNLGVIHDEGEGAATDDAEAMRWYRKAADLGHAGAMNSIGSLYDNGEGVPKDAAEAMRWFRKSADLGDPMAMTNIGFLYERGEGLAKNDAEAVRWYRLAADRGNPQAMHNLASHLDQGKVVAKDSKLAASYIFQALKAGNDFTREEMVAHGKSWSPEFRRELLSLIKAEGSYDGAIDDGNFGPDAIRAIEALATK